MNTVKTNGINHLGLTVRDLPQTTAFFCDVLGWDIIAQDPDYPRNTVSDGIARLTLWQVKVDDPAPFDRKTAVGLHHVALEVADEATLLEFGKTLNATDGVDIEFMPEFMGSGPRKHMMFAEPGGLRIELVWAGA